ncbi:MAG: ectoine hydroxylase-related dioxygenase (phytanoyl-CoA dioxygenase family) [Bacteriovoracaceae bacterium]|jgi:ectoine hydroxylase-related dioxygenase (phytanoyl-CoA dioxygenase family)
MKTTSLSDNFDQPFVLSAKEIAFYDDNGFLIIEDFLDETSCDKLIEDAFAFAKEDIHNYLSFHRELPSYKSLITHPFLLDAADQLQRARMIPIGSIFFFGKPNNPLENGSLPHQDNYAAKAPSGSYFVVALSLDDCDEENGALGVYPGSHKLGELPFTETKNFVFGSNGKLEQCFPIGNEVSVPKDLEPNVLSYKKGSLILLHSNTIHFASKNINKNDRWRKMIYMHFIKDGDPFWPGWNARRQIMDRIPKRV